MVVALEGFIGVGLIAAAIILAPVSGGTRLTRIGGTGILGAGTFAAATSIAIGSIGTSLLLGGVAEMLSPQPTIPTLGGGNTGRGRTAPGENTNATGPQGVSRATSGEQSYAFSGPANTVGVGATVPLVYGKMLIGSHLISSKVAVTSESDPTGEFFPEPGPSSITINGEKPGYKFVSHNGAKDKALGEQPSQAWRL